MKHIDIKINGCSILSKTSVIALVLLIWVLIAYWPLQYNGFISNYDDMQYVLDNKHVISGITLENIRWAFTSFCAANWHPLTWISHMIDCELYGLDAGGHHLTSLIFHIANTLLLFLFLKSATGTKWRSGFVALLFAVHPLHVESVAWVAERKDVLSTFFWLLALLAYLYYIRKPSVTKYLLITLFFVCGLMAKPMVVTFPFVLLILDYWPLERVILNGAIKLSLKNLFKRDSVRKINKLVVEKIPLMLLSV
ncbi:MAG: glycosyltransferase family 39 protein, partial [Candidatus Omnitrophica bacterium]|nr:glycosyltransferase family 39 protein [Candidatus Omnitrophota bacterium]